MNFLISEPDKVHYRRAGQLFSYCPAAPVAASPCLYTRHIMTSALHHDQHGTDYKITSVTMSFCQSVCEHSYGRNFDSILMKFCTVIRARKTRPSLFGIKIW